jgi:hypothetical protein
MFARLRRMSFKKQIATFLTTFAALIAGVAFAAWTATGTGFGYAKAKTAVALTTVAVVPAATLYPGQTAGDAQISIVNGNDYPVTVTTVTGTGTIVTNPTVAACDLSTGVTFTNQTGLSLSVPAHSAGTPFTLTGSVAMTNASDNSCQGATFQIPVSLSGTS